MKVLIWIGCFLIASILNVLLGYATGFKAGYVVFYLAVGHAAKKLCQLWDDHKAAKAAQQQSPTPPPTAAPQARYCKYCGEPLIEGGRFCRKCGGEITQ